ncbi:hypothetical protein OIU34_17360 [Pararhizobium sp. BT-229]|uniref:hypothetical protein n=1 Tax=Pararhizobium sp. BT-229 TaxID=2986923 RepID=UPI0021F6C1BE|nr:hypothetical protein [Pararhizobium sp. BT-229]MCV9963671.1 hypothetical protein [Pararhizobium sp. BT-229]
MGNNRISLAGALVAAAVALPRLASATDDRVAEAQFVPECASPPGNGEVLTSRGILAEGGHALQISNGAKGNAIIKVRDTRDNAVVLSFYVGGSREVTIQGIPDGDYTVQYATGDALDLGCRQFIELKWAEQFPGVQSFRTERTATQIITSVLSYTLYEVAGGNVEPQTISAEAFNQP